VVDTIEVIGHTDQQRVSGTLSDLDMLLVPATEGRTPLEKVRFASNVELGFLRAVAVMQRIRAAQAEQRLPALPVHAYSAAQLIASSSDGSGDPKNRRRIEIRLARLKAPPSPVAPGPK
jgi:flagellar motor protein MotB